MMKKVEQTFLIFCQTLEFKVKINSKDLILREYVSSVLLCEQSMPLAAFAKIGNQIKLLAWPTAMTVGAVGVIKWSAGADKYMTGPKEDLFQKDLINDVSSMSGEIVGWQIAKSKAPLPVKWAGVMIAAIAAFENMLYYENELPGWAKRGQEDKLAAWIGFGGGAVGVWDAARGIKVVKNLDAQITNAAEFLSFLKRNPSIDELMLKNVHITILELIGNGKTVDAAEVVKIMGGGSFDVGLVKYKEIIKAADDAALAAVNDIRKVFGSGERGQVLDIFKTDSIETILSKKNISLEPTFGFNNIDLEDIVNKLRTGQESPLAGSKFKVGDEMFTSLSVEKTQNGFTLKGDDAAGITREIEITHSNKATIGDADLVLKRSLEKILRSPGEVFDATSAKLVNAFNNTPVGRSITKSTSLIGDFIKARVHGQNFSRGIHNNMRDGQQLAQEFKRAGQHQNADIVRTYVKGTNKDVVVFRLEYNAGSGGPRRSALGEPGEKITTTHHVGYNNNVVVTANTFEGKLVTLNIDGKLVEYEIWSTMAKKEYLSAWDEVIKTIPKDIRKAVITRAAQHAGISSEEIKLFPEVQE